MLRNLTKRRPAPFFVMLSLLALVGAVAAACADGSPSEQEATTNLCDDLDAFSESFTSLISLDPNTTSVDDIKDATSEVRDDLGSVVDSASDVGGTRGDELQDAYDSLNGAVDDLDEDQTVPQAVDSLEPAVQEVGSAWRNVFSSVPCDSPQQGGSE